MEITLIGYILIPVCFAATILSSRKMLLYLLIFFSPFTGTAIINYFAYPTFGIQPAYFIGLLFIFRIVTDFAINKLPHVIPQIQSSALLPLWLFGIAAFISILLIPIYSTVEVNRPSGAIELLQLTKENFTQFTYLAYVITLTTCIALSRLHPEEVYRCLKIMIASGIFVSLWGWLQVTMFYTGYSYPDFLFNNNVSFSQGFEQHLSALGIKRMNSVAPEPSMLGRFLLIPTFVSWYCVYRIGFVINHKLAIVSALFLSLTLLSTTSTTAFIGLVGGLIIFLFFIIISSIHWRSTIKLKPEQNKRSAKSVLAVLVMLPLLVVTMFHIAKWKLGFDMSMASGLLDIVLLEKLASQSGQGRLEGAILGLNLFVSHPFLGIGWGSNRTFDLLTNLLSTVGFIGAFFFVWTHLIIARKTIRLIRYLVRTGLSFFSACPEVLLLVFIIVLFGKVLSDPDIVFLDHWILIGLMITALRWPRQVKTRITAPTKDRSLGAVRVWDG